MSEHPGDPTNAETVAYFNAKTKRLEDKIKKLSKVLDELCANAEPVCDSLEMGQMLKSPETLAKFRKALNDGWQAL